jgi:hypothetical protein
MQSLSKSTGGELANFGGLLAQPPDYPLLLSPQTEQNVQRPCLVGLHHRRSGQHTGREFQIVQVFAAEILGEARIQSLP